MVENNDMRETLKSMQAELINLLNQQNEDYESNTEVGIHVYNILAIIHMYFSMHAPLS